MTNAVRVRTRLGAETLQLPELLPFMGRRVEVIVFDEEGETIGPPKIGEALDGLEEVHPPSAVAKRILGRLRGQLTVPSDFDDPLPDEILRAFEGEDHD